MKKLLIYPFTKELCPLARFRTMLKGYTLTAAVPEKGYGWEGKDTCELDGGEPTGLMLSSFFSDELDKCDAVLLYINEQERDEKEYKESIKLIKSAKKEIITLPQNIITEIDFDFNPDMKLKDIPVPIITVMGLGHNCQKFDIQLSLREAFIREGYKVSQYGTKPYSNLFGFEALPSIPELPLWKKVYLYNDLLRNKYDNEKPDVMIIGVPGGIMPITSNIYEMFGEAALSIAYAAKPDISLLSYYLNIPTKEYFDLYKQFMRFRFGISDIYFHASNTSIQIGSEFEKPSYLTHNIDFLFAKLKEPASEIYGNVFNVLSQQSRELFYQKIIEQLQQNIEII